MLQIIQSYRTGEMELAEVPVPVCDDNGVLVRTAVSLVSAGTEKMLVDLAKKSLAGKALARPDLVRQVVGKMKKEGVRQTLEKVFTKLDNPIPLGYSCAGRVVAVGRNVTEFKVGDWVACGGAGYANHAELNYVPRNLAVRLPDGLDPEAASFATVGAIAMQGVRQAEVQLGHRVGVIGLGLLGQLTVQILKASGARVLCTDIAPAKLELARKLGADVAVAPDRFAAEALNMGDGHGLDAVIITASTSSNQPVETAGEACRYKGKVVVVGMVGMDIPRNEYYKKELDLRLSMSYGPGRYDAGYEEKGIDYPYSLVRWTEGRNMQTFLELCAEGRVTPAALVTHRFGFDKALDAYSLFEGKTGEPYLGILLTYDMEKPQPAHVVMSVPVAKAAAGGTLRLGLVGAGNFAKGVLLPRLASMKDVTIAAIATATGVSARGTAKKYGIGKLFADTDALLRDPDVNAVLVTTRHNRHAGEVLGALEAGKHVFVEKPLCLNEEELVVIRTTYEAASPRPVLTVGFNRRFSSHAVKLREWVAASGERAVIRYRVNGGFIPRQTWVQDPDIGGGRILGEACHFVDLCSFIAGADVEEVYASALETPGEYSGDVVCITLKHANGARSTLDYLANGDPSLPKEVIEVFCARGVATCEDFSVTTFSRGGKRSKHKTSGMDKGFDAELAAFRDAALGRASLPISFDSLANTTRATFRILESVATGEPRKV
jgi:predicted dehydrogenase/threonine dehydrogenase-like Zn-dependent dehydrogenase